ncbi:lysophospholipid acyltransferase family protein [Paraburkholderia heleia]|uniref:lysophospholipid acyltransferase family protein n=1 Tax=Paraburkholderia heleia TaxID=634127 RepID=UPI002AB6B78F|nr:lysophospholipid acyltransferase family protein [Paraburkholderia heleia]
MNNFLQRRLLDVVRLIVASYGRFAAVPTAGRQTIYFANHTSHLDTLAILAALPKVVRDAVRPVAARDYWDSSSLKRFVAKQILDVVFVERNGTAGTDPLKFVRGALASGSSIIIFPEGTRSATAEIGAFRSGLYRLALEFPDVDLVPVYLSNVARAMPKGKVLPIPLMCQVLFGEAMLPMAGEEKSAFLERARQSVVALRG